MKLRSAPLDEVYNELDFILRNDSRFLAAVALWLSRKLYGLCHRFLLSALRLPWRNSATPAGFPPIGQEPFNISSVEMKEYW